MIKVEEIAPAPTRMVSLDKWCEVTGIPRTTFLGWKRKLTRGVHYAVYGRTTLIDVEALEQWLRESDGGEQRGSCASRTKGSSSQKQRNIQKMMLV